MFESFSKKFTVKHTWEDSAKEPSEVPLLMYLEHNGDTSILHCIVWGFNMTLDVKLEGEADGMEARFKAVETVVEAQQYYDSLLYGFIEKVAAFDPTEDESVAEKSQEE